MTNINIFLTPLLEEAYPFLCYACRTVSFWPCSAQGQVSSYIMTAIVSILRKCSESKSRCWKGFSARTRNTSVGVTLLNSFQACQTECLPFQNKHRVGITTDKCLNHRKTMCSGLSKGSAYLLDANESEVLSRSKGSLFMVARRYGGWGRGGYC